jgi:hypothetical protein
MTLQTSMIMQLMLGFMLLAVGPSAVAKQRAKLLAERDAAGPDSKTRYEEAAPDPDIVWTSTMTGVLSLLSIPFLFGPAAIVSGGIAVSRGHGKGMLGVVLGFVGIVGWVVLLFVLAH